MSSKSSIATPDRNARQLTRAQSIVSTASERLLREIRSIGTNCAILDTLFLVDCEKLDVSQKVEEPTSTNPYAKYAYKPKNEKKDLTKSKSSLDASDSMKAVSKKKKKNKFQYSYDTSSIDFIVPINDDIAKRFDWASKLSAKLMKDASQRNDEEVSHVSIKAMELIECRILPILAFEVATKNSTELPKIFAADTDHLIVRINFGGPFGSVQLPQIQNSSGDSLLDNIQISFTHRLLSRCSPSGHSKTGARTTLSFPPHVTLSETLDSHRRLSNRNIFRWCFQLFSTLLCIGSSFNVVDPQSLIPDCVVLSSDALHVHDLQVSKQVLKRIKLSPSYKNNKTSNKNDSHNDSRSQNEKGPGTSDVSNAKRVLGSDSVVSANSAINRILSFYRRKERRPDSDVNTAQASRDAWLDVHSVYFLQRHADYVTNIHKNYEKILIQNLENHKNCFALRVIDQYVQQKKINIYRNQKSRSSSFTNDLNSETEDIRIMSDGFQLLKWNFSDLLKLETRSGTASISMKTCDELETEYFFSMYVVFCLLFQMNIRYFGFLVLRMCIYREFTSTEWEYLEKVIIDENLEKERMELEKERLMKYKILREKIDSEKNEANNATNDEKVAKEKKTEKKEEGDDDGSDDFSDVSENDSPPPRSSHSNRPKTSKSAKLEKPKQEPTPWELSRQNDLNASEINKCFERISPEELYTRFPTLHKTEPLLKSLINQTLSAFYIPKMNESSHTHHDPSPVKWATFAAYKDILTKIKNEIVRLNNNIDFEKEILWTEEDEEARLKKNEDYKKDMDEKCVLGRNKAIERVKKEQYKAWFDLQSEEVKRKIIRREKAEARTNSNHKHRMKMLHYASFHAWSSPELRQWILEALFSAYKAARVTQKQYGYRLVGNMSNQPVVPSSTTSKASGSSGSHGAPTRPAVSLIPPPTNKNSPEYIAYYEMVSIIDIFPQSLMLKLLPFMGLDCSVATKTSVSDFEYLQDQDRLCRVFFVDLVDQMIAKLDPRVLTLSMDGAIQQVEKKFNTGNLALILTEEAKKAKSKVAEIDALLTTPLGNRGIRESGLHIVVEAMFLDGDWVTVMSRTICGILLEKYHRQNHMRLEGENIAASKLAAGFKMMKMRKIVRDIWRQVSVEVDELDRQERQRKISQLCGSGDNSALSEDTLSELNNILNQYNSKVAAPVSQAKQGKKAEKSDTHEVLHQMKLGEIRSHGSSMKNFCLRSSAIFLPTSLLHNNNPVNLQPLFENSGKTDQTHLVYNSSNFKNRCIVQATLYIDFSQSNYGDIVDKNASSPNNIVFSDSISYLAIIALVFNNPCDHISNDVNSAGQFIITNASQDLESPSKKIMGNAKRSRKGHVAILIYDTRQTLDIKRTIYDMYLQSITKKRHQTSVQDSSMETYEPVVSYESFVLHNYDDDDTRDSICMPKILPISFEISPDNSHANEKRIDDKLSLDELEDMLGIDEDSKNTNKKSRKQQTNDLKDMFANKYEELDKKTKNKIQPNYFKVDILVGNLFGHSEYDIRVHVNDIFFPKLLKDRNTFVRFSPEPQDFRLVSMPQLVKTVLTLPESIKKLVEAQVSVLPTSHDQESSHVFIHRVLSPETVFSRPFSTTVDQSPSHYLTSGSPVTNSQKMVHNHGHSNEPYHIKCGYKKLNKWQFSPSLSVAVQLKWKPTNGNISILHASMRWKFLRYVNNSKVKIAWKSQWIPRNNLTGTSSISEHFDLRQILFDFGLVDVLNEGCFTFQITYKLSQTNEFNATSTESKIPLSVPPVVITIDKHKDDFHFENRVFEELVKKSQVPKQSSSIQDAKILSDDMNVIADWLDKLGSSCPLRDALEN